MKWYHYLSLIGMIFLLVIGNTSQTMGIFFDDTYQWKQYSIDGSSYQYDEFASTNMDQEKIIEKNLIKILFLGSSYFNFNDLPVLFEEFALNAGKQVYIDSLCINGWYLDDHANSAETEAKINQMDWDYVILQGCGINIAYPEHDFTPPAYPAIVTLRDKIYANCETSKIIFCMPWAFEDGMTWYEDWTDTFADMQLLIFENTLEYADEIGFQIAPVGWAWYTVLEDQEYPLHYLHMSDWNHPSLRGSYVMTCVIFSTIYLETSLGVSYTAGLPEEEVSNFQDIASDTVLNDLYLWNLKEPDMIWNKTYGGTNLDWGWSIQSTSDGGLIMGGETISYGSGGYDAYLIKTDEQGNVLFDKTFGGSEKDGCRAVKQTNDNGFILGGYADSYGYPGHDFWLLKTDENGNEEWSYTYGGPESDAAVSVIQTSQGDYVLVGYSYSFSNGKKDVWVVKTDEQGNELWNANYGGGDNDQGMSVVESTDGGYVIVGYTESYGSGGSDVWVLKIDSEGNLEWDTLFGGFQNDWGGSIDATADGGYIISGDTMSFGNGGFDAWLIKINGNGIEQWNATYGSDESHETGYCVEQTRDNGFIISGTSMINGIDNGLVMKVDENGYCEWEKIFLTDDSDIFYTICEPEIGTYVALGYTYTYGAGNMDIWAIKMGGYQNIAPIADFSYSPESPAADEMIQFIDESQDPDGYIINWTWDFGEGIIKYGEQVTHSFSDNGTYQVTLLVVDNEFSEGIMRKNLIVDHEDSIDVNQSVFDRGFPIRHALDGDWASAQNFMPTLSTISRVSILLRRFGSPEFNLTIELRTDTPWGPLLDTLQFKPDETPSSWEWFDINFDNIAVVQDTEYFIICPPAPHGVTTSFGYEWAYAFGNQYDEGSFWFTRDGGTLWRDLPTMYEFAFITYGYN